MTCSRCAAVLIAVIMSMTSVAAASPAKKDAVAFVKELKAAVKANDRVLEARTGETVRAHNRWYRELQDRGARLFARADDSCSFAVMSAAALWASQEQYSRRPDQVGYQMMQRDRDNYRDNLELCQRAISKLK